MPEKKLKLFVLDTNVILHDSSCIYQFEENDIVLPMSVLEELDQFKKGSDSLNFHAREFVRSLDALAEDKLFNGGLEIAPGLGTISISLDFAFHETISRSFSEKKADHRILNTAYCLSKADVNHDVILVTKDVNLRMKAKAVGLQAEDYTSDHVKDVGELYEGYGLEDDVCPEIIDRLYRQDDGIPVEELAPRQLPKANEYRILKAGKHSVLAQASDDGRILGRVEKWTAYGISPRNAEQIFALDALLNNEIQLVSLTGKAGTGKTLMALAAALERRRSFHQIFMARPIVPLSNKDIGFLPGDIKSKLDPYMQPLFDNLGVIRNQFKESDKRNLKITEMLNEDKLVISPLSYIRGRSLVKVFFIVDEAQNLTPHEVKTIITRAGEGTKIIFTGDIFQIDHPWLDSQSNGLSYLIEKMRGQRPYAHIDLKKGERSELAELASNLL